MKNRIWAYLLTVGLVLGSVTAPVRADRQPDAGEESMEVIRLSSTEDFFRLASDCRLDTWSENKLILLEADINFTNLNTMTVIPYFKGTFDGQGHTVSGLAVSREGSAQGLFRYIGEGGTVQNLNVIGTVAPQGSMALVGGIAGENHGTIRNCTYAGVVRGGSGVGGIAGSNEETGVIMGCRASGIVHGDHYTGGIAGKNGGTIQNCINKANVNTSTEELTLNLEYINLENIRSTENTTDITDIGGIAGYSSGKIESCTNNGTVGYPHVGYNVGGITGRQTGYVNNCINYGTIYGRKDIGGINGQMEPYHTLLFSESVLAKLDEQLAELQAGVNRLLDDAGDYSDTVTGRLEEMYGHVANAQGSVESMLDQIQGVYNTDAETLNELSSRVSDTIEKLVPVSEELAEASGSVKKIVRRLRELADGLEDATDISRDGLEAFTRALDKLEDAQADFETASEPLANARESFAAAGEAFAEAVRLKQEGASEAEIEQKTREGSDALSKGLEAVDVAGRSLGAGLTDVSDAAAALGDALPCFLEAGDSAGDILTDAGKTLDEVLRMSSSMTEAMAGIERALQDLAEKKELSFATLDEDFDVSQDMLSESVAEVTDILNFLNKTIAEKNDRIGDDIRVISDQLFAITDTIQEAFSEEEEDKSYIEDISYEDTGEQTEGKAAFCSNYGIIEGDVNVGGITGSMAIEYDFDPEDDVKTEGEFSKDFIYQTRAVIRACRNHGEVTAKKNSVGGIVGNMDLGSVIDCEAYGSVTSAGGRYTGGIAGYSQADIRNSYAKCVLSGEDYVGGIAGQGDNIFRCRSLVRIDNSGEYTGAIAGKATGTLEENYFVSEENAGVDDISYTGQAEPVAYETLAVMEGIPEEFRSFRLAFQAGKEIVYETVFSYGEDLSGLELPQLPAVEGSYAEWEQADFSHMVFDTTVHAVYEDNITALESAQKRNDLPLLVAEGSFAGGDRISLTAETDSADQTEGSRVLEVWRLELPEDGNVTHRLQYLSPTGASGAALECWTESGWVRAAAERDGQYLVWEADGQELLFRIVRADSSLPLLLAAAGAAAALALLLAAVWRKSLRSTRVRSNRMKEEER